MSNLDEWLWMAEVLPGMIESQSGISVLPDVASSLIGRNAE
jgi:hypothetical protein